MSTAGCGLLVGRVLRLAAGPLRPRMRPPLVLEHLTHRRRAAAGHGVRHPAGFAGLRLARHRRRPGPLRRPRAGPLRLFAQDDRRVCRATSSIRSSKTRITICGSRSRTRASPAGTGRRITSPSIATTRATPPPSRAMPRTPCSSMRGAGSGSERAMRVSTFSIPRSGRFEHLRHDAADAELAEQRPDLHARP